MKPTPEQLKERTKRFALRIIKLADKYERNVAVESIVCQLLRAGTAVALLLGMVSTAVGESALMGWETTTNGERYVVEVHMVGPTKQNKMPEKKGIFKGEFLSDTVNAGELMAIHRVSLHGNEGLKTEKVGFKMVGQVSSETVEINGVKLAKVRFETESLSFEETDWFVLIFKSGPADRKEVKMVMVQIIPVFVPS
jgi:hypothetical protein